MLPRVITQFQPTLLMDEIDTFAAGNEAIRGILNTGFDKNNFVVIGVRVGDDCVSQNFVGWYPQALAGIGNLLHDTTVDRSFCIDLERKPRGKAVNRLRERDTGPLEELAQKCARWAADNIGELVDATPEISEALNDGAADAWELCIAIADRCSAEWGRPQVPAGSLGDIRRRGCHQQRRRAAAV
jgi:hypothetical protein